MGGTQAATVGNRLLLQHCAHSSFRGGCSHASTVLWARTREPSDAPRQPGETGPCTVILHSAVCPEGKDGLWASRGKEPTRLRDVSQTGAWTGWEEEVRMVGTVISCPLMRTQELLSSCCFSPGSSQADVLSTFSVTEDLGSTVKDANQLFLMW